jgi:hypothetical protein
MASLLTKGFQRSLLLDAGYSWHLLAHQPHHRFCFIDNTREPRLTRQDTLLCCIRMPRSYWSM